MPDCCLMPPPPPPAGGPGSAGYCHRAGAGLLGGGIHDAQRQSLQTQRNFQAAGGGGEREGGGRGERAGEGRTPKALKPEVCVPGIHLQCSSFGLLISPTPPSPHRLTSCAYQCREAPGRTTQLPTLPSSSPPPSCRQAGTLPAYPTNCKAPLFTAMSRSTPLTSRSRTRVASSSFSRPCGRC